MPIIFVPEYVVNVQDVVTVFVIIAVILDALAWLGKDTSRVPRRLVFECRVAYPIGGW